MEFIVVGDQLILLEKNFPRESFAMGKSKAAVF
jgi:hypothetical protein